MQHKINFIKVLNKNDPFLPLNGIFLRNFCRFFNESKKRSIKSDRAND